MATTAVSLYEPMNPDVLEKALVDGDLAKLSASQRLAYIGELCKQTGLNALTRPFDFIKDDQGKLRLYVRKDAAEQLRKAQRISVRVVNREMIEEMYIVTVRATLPDGREDEATGVVALDGLQGQKRANKMMVAETKAKRRVTLAISGLGAHEGPDDEPRQGAGDVNLQTGEIVPHPVAALPARGTADKQHLLDEISLAMKETLRPLKHAGMFNAVVYHSFRVSSQELPKQGPDALDRGMPLFRHLCAALRIHGLPTLHPDDWIAQEIQKLAGKALTDITDADYTEEGPQEAPGGTITPETSQKSHQDTAANLEDARGQNEGNATQETLWEREAREAATTAGAEA